MNIMAAHHVTDLWLVHTDIPLKWSSDSMVDTMFWLSAERQGIVLQLSVGGRDFSHLQNIRTSSRVHPAFYSMGKWGTFCRSKAAGA